MFIRRTKKTSVSNINNKYKLPLEAEKVIIVFKSAPHVINFIFLLLNLTLTRVRIWQDKNKMWSQKSVFISVKIQFFGIVNTIFEFLGKFYINFIHDSL